MKSFPQDRSWRGWGLYALMSAFVTWHAIALIVGPAPRESAIAQAIRPAVDPYLDLLYLNVGWGFFAPVGMTGEFRYRIEDAAGKVHAFTPTRNLPWYHPRALWTKDRYRTISRFTKFYGERAAAEMCAAHRELKPVRVVLFEIEQVKEFTPAHHKAGKTPLDPEFTEEKVLGTYPCPKT